MADPVAKVLVEMAAVLEQRPETRNWIDEFRSGEMLLTDQAAEIAATSRETIRRRCEASADTDRPLAILFAGSVWIVSRSRLFDWIELHEGKPAMLAAISRAEKLTEMRSSPQQSFRRRVTATG